MTFAEKVKKLRKLLDVTQTKLASLLKSSQAAVACWETGITKCKPETLVAIEKLCIKKCIKINWRK